MKSKLLAIAVALAGATSAHAVNLTGTWEGSYSCTNWNGAPSKDKVPDSTLLIFQEGASVSAIIDNGSGGTYRGATIDATAKPTEQGEVVLNACTTDGLPLADSASELVRLKVKVNAAKGTGTLSGVSYFEQPGNLLTCKLKYKRVSTTPGKFAGCEAM